MKNDMLLILITIISIVSVAYKYSLLKSVNEQKCKFHYMPVLNKNATHKRKFNLKKYRYILSWNGNMFGLGILENGRKTFLKNNCPVSNCVVTRNKKLLQDIKDFSAILFAGPCTRMMKPSQFPKRRSPHQKYIFASIEPSGHFHVHDRNLNGYFNWTWTHKLGSDLTWGYVIVRNSRGELVAPKDEVHWTEDMSTPINENLKKKLRSKSKAAAWFVSRCRSRSRREAFVLEAQKYLAAYNLSVDIYGKCGRYSCPRSESTKCNKMLERDYFFYFSFENSFEQEYVSEKLMIPLKHNTVPVVYGGANYSRFMPDGMYLNAVSLGPMMLAEKIHEIMRDPEKYYSFFKYKGHYSFHLRHDPAHGAHDACTLCAKLNDNNAMRTSVRYDLQKWWNKH